MIPAGNAIDLVILVADKDMQQSLEGLLQRDKSLGIRSISTRIFSHPKKDPGVFNEAHLFLRAFHKSAGHCLVMLDHEGCGARAGARDAIETTIETRLARNGWQNRSAAIVLDPELEAWVWSDSPHVDSILGWPCGDTNLRDWLIDQGFLEPGSPKPIRPKEAVEAALRYARRRRSSALYRELAEKVRFSHCHDASFVKFLSTLRSWFPAGQRLETHK